MGQSFKFMNIQYYDMADKRDGLIVQVIKQGTISNAQDKEKLRRSIDTCGSGIYKLGIYGPKWGHATAFSNEGGSNGKRSWFDPNLGQFSVKGSGGPGELIIRVLNKVYPDTNQWTIKKYGGVPRDRSWLMKNA